MGRTYMEAGACGIPVVAARVGGVPSVVTNNVNGLLVDDPLDRDDIAAMVDRLLADEDLRRRMGQTGLKMAREEFSWERVAAAFEEVMAASVGHSDSRPLYGHLTGDGDNVANRSHSAKKGIDSR